VVRLRLRSRRLTVVVHLVAAVLLILVLFTSRALYHLHTPDRALTSAQQAEPYAEFDRPLVAPSAALEAAVSKPMDCNDALPISDINKLLDPGYQKVETGYCLFDDGGGYASALIDVQIGDSDR
jgi:hypothetical protein